MADYARSGEYARHIVPHDTLLLLYEVGPDDITHRFQFREWGNDRLVGQLEVPLVKRTDRNKKASRLILEGGQQVTITAAQEGLESIAEERYTLVKIWTDSGFHAPGKIENKTVLAERMLEGDYIRKKREEADERVMKEPISSSSQDTFVERLGR